MKNVPRVATKRAVVVVISTGVLGLVGGAAFAGMSDTPAGVASTPGGWAVTGVDPAFPTNAQGQTYGSALQVSSPENEPDLILVNATNGKTGYVSKIELDQASGGNVQNPEEALAFQRIVDAAASAGEGFVINVYAADGKTVVGEFIISPSKSGASG